MKRVYIAGAISSDKLEKGISNLRKGILMGAELLKLGYAPFVPHLDFLYNLVQDDSFPVETYYQYDLEWLSVCNMMLVLPDSENSKGVQAEIEFAKQNNIPIFYSLNELLLDENFAESVVSLEDICQEL